jgi:dipeptidyl aminopeptidase/acylaminoacyl peptidase
MRLSMRKARWPIVHAIYTIILAVGWGCATCEDLGLNRIFSRPTGPESQGVFIETAGKPDSAKLLAEGTQPALSPAGDRIVYVSTENGDAEIVIMDLEGKNRVQLTDNDVAERSPSWSQDGREIVFESEGKGGAFETVRLTLDAKTEEAGR